MSVIVISLLKNGENSIDLPFCTSLRELKFKNKIDFDVCYHKLLEAKERADFTIYDYCYHLSECISAYTGIKLDDFLDLDVGSSYEDLQFCFDILVSIFGEIIEIINSYEYNGEDNEFVYKDIRFIIPKKTIDEVLHLDKYDKIKLGQFIKINAIKKVLNDLEDNYKKDGSTIYTDVLSTLAVLAESENYSYDNSTAYVQAMIKFFDDIDTQTAMDISFFLTITWGLSQNVRNYSIFSSHLQQEVEKHQKRLKEYEV